MKRKFLVKCLLAVMALTTAASAQVRNGDLGKRGANPPYFTQETVAKLRADGWTCPDIGEWPWWWSAWGGKVSITWPAAGGHSGGYGQISGAGGYLTGYHGHELKGDQVLTVWAKGKGTLTAGFTGYGRTESGEIRGMGAPPAMTVAVNGEHWMRYRHLLRPAETPGLYSVHVLIAVPEGTIAFDDVELLPATPAEALLVTAETQLRAQGGLLADADVVATDTAFRERVGIYREAIAEFAKGAETMDAVLRDSLAETIKRLDPYLLGDGKTAVHATQYNDMLILTHALKRLRGQAATAAPAPAVSAVAGGAIALPLPGVRPARPGTMTITDIRSNKVRYDENETATTKATVVNLSGKAFLGTLVADMILDVDSRREIARTEFTVPAGATQPWTFSYNVGPETYGRAIEVRFVTADGVTLDAWQEYYAVAAEWFRVQQANYTGTMKSYAINPYTTYYNQRHYFAAEPTDWGVQTDQCEKLEQYLSGQVMYHMNMNHRRAEMAYFRQMGNRGTFYQCFGYCGQMGYEVIRQHPEFSLYDANGQFAVDPIYGGNPNPFELASPMEIGPKRKVLKPYLDRRLSSWQHHPLNYANEETIAFMAESIQRQAEFLHCDGIYIDGNLGVFTGYGYDGKANVLSGKYDDIVALNARNHRLFSEILKKDNPTFGTWFNWTRGANEYYAAQGLTFYLGSGGSSSDPKDDSLKAAASWRNVMFLDETVFQFSGGDSACCYPDRHLDHLCQNRDDLVQGYDANVIIGYIANYIGIEQDIPGPDRWGWATHNYFGAQIIATQHHFVSWFLPSWRPTIQFTTRYSRFLWAPDIDIVKDAAKLVSVTGTDQLWWKRLVYRRNSADGYDLIVHLVRIPPYEKWDLKWLDEPNPLESVRLAVNAGPGKLRDVQAMRPYYFDEPQQPVQRKVEAVVSNGRVAITVPEFRYHTMVVFRFAK